MATPAERVPKYTAEPISPDGTLFVTLKAQSAGEPHRIVRVTAYRFSRSTSLLDHGRVGNGPATVKQTADALTIERTMGDAKVTLTYKLDGTESRNMMMGRGGQPADSVSTAKWDGPKLTIVTKQEMGGQVTESTQVWTVEGSTLTVETTNARGTQKRVYKK